MGKTLQVGDKIICADIEDLKEWIDRLNRYGYEFGFHFMGELSIEIRKLPEVEG